MGKIIGDTACPACVAKGKDRTLNHLILFEDGGSYCPKCGYKGDNVSIAIVEGITKRKLDTMEEFNEISNLPITALATRGIDQDVAEHFGIHTAYSTATGEPEAHYYPFTVAGKTLAYKKRTLPKSFCSIGASLKGVPVEFMGQSVAQGGKRLLITEGPDDAAAAFQMLWRKYPQHKPSVVSLPHGANIKVFLDNADFLNGFEEVIFCPDSDEPGQAVAREIAGLLPKCKFMKLSEHDANDMLKVHKEKEFINAYFRAAAHVPDELLTVEDVYESSIKMPAWGKLWPWPSLDKLTYGRRLGEGIYVAAAVKAGKTEWLSQMVHHVVTTEGNKALLIKFEQSPDQTVKAIAGKIMNKNFSVPDGDFTQEELIEGVEQTKGKLLMFDAYMTGEAQAHNMWDRLKPVIRHCVLVEGVEDVFIDPITQLTDGMPASDTDVELRRFSNELAGLAQELGFFYYAFAHLKAPATGPTHEEGGKVRVAQMRGSRAMIEKTKYALGIVRNQYDEDEIKRNTSQFHLLLNSGFGKTGIFDVFYDDVKGSYLEPGRDYI